jgi:serine/threonine-protein kinase
LYDPPVPLTPGSRFGSFVIVSPLGAGGMGEVYRARDTRLGRMVALKVLPDDVARDPVLLARFDREARLLASLQHPSIASLFGLESAGDHPALVLELVDGITLAQRIAKGPCTIEQAITIARQIADALEAAHERGIVHRDLKPGNVKLTDSGAVKVLDFGLATIFAPNPAEMPSAAPTLGEGMTQSGMILGTPGYMAPEQVLGQPADRRADIWAFGVVLWELLTGTRMFRGTDHVATQAAALHAEIDWSVLPAGTPASLLRLLRRTLQRDRTLRLRDIADARLDLDDALEELRDGGAATAAGAPAPPPPRPALRRTILWGAGVIAAGLVVAAVLVRGPGRSNTAPAIAVRSEVPLADGVQLDGWGSPVVALSPDGRRLAYVGRRPGQPAHLYLHDLAQGETLEVPHSRTAEGPFFSPDGQAVAFAVGTSVAGPVAPQLMRYSIATGLTQKLCDLDDYFGGAWSVDGVLYFINNALDGVYRVGAGGGKAEAVVGRFKTADADSAIRMVMWPQLLPGGRHLVVSDQSAGPENRAAVLDLETRELRPLAIEANFTRYVPTGHLAYVRPDQSLMTIGFDPRTRTVHGEPTARMRDISTSGSDASVFDVSRNGMVVFTTGYLRGSLRELFQPIRVSAGAGTQPLRIGPDEFGRTIRISPDGRRAATCTYDGSVWVFDLARGTRLRVHQSPRSDYAVWSPDGRRIAFAAEGANQDGLYIVPADGSAPAERVLQRPAELHSLGFTPDGSQLVFIDRQGQERMDGVPGVYTLATDGSGRWQELVSNGLMGALSPDGRWLAYISTERMSLIPHIRRTDGSGPGVPITNVAARDPVWSRDGRELYYREGDDLMAVSVTGTDEPHVGEPERIATIPDMRGYDALPGRREFIALQRVPGSGIHTRLRLVTSWFSELEESSAAVR